MRHQLSRLFFGIVTFGCLISLFLGLQGKGINQLLTQPNSSSSLASQVSICLSVSKSQYVFRDSSRRGSAITRKGDNKEVTVIGTLKTTGREENKSIEIFIPQQGNGIPPTGWIRASNPPWKTVRCP
jgi:hypothetical protein